MQVWNGLTEVPGDLGPTVVTIGNFDGVHRGHAEVLRSVVDQARERATDTWDKLEKVFEERVQRALVKLGVPGRDDLNTLSQRVDRLTAELRKANTPSAKPAVKRAARTPATAKRVAKKPAAKKPAARKAVRKSPAVPASTDAA